MRKLRFTKMHGAGNDFIVIDGTTQNLSQIDPSLWRKLAHRQLGIGADQILLVEKSSGPKADFKYRIFNADGGEVEQCGNGSRCFVRFVHDQGRIKNWRTHVNLNPMFIKAFQGQNGMCYLHPNLTFRA